MGRGLRHVKAACWRPSRGVARVDWDAWLYAPGLPPVENTFDGSRRADARDLAVRWHTADPLGMGGAGAYADKFSSADIASFSSDILIIFGKSSRCAACGGSLDAVRALEAAYELMRKNSEVRLLWIRLRGRGDEGAIPMAVAFVKAAGRMKFLRPTYRSLLRRGGAFEAAARATFEEARPSYHPIASKMVAQDLGIE